MTTEITRTIFGIPVGGTKTLNNKEMDLQINPINDSRVMVGDNAMFQYTRVDRIHATLEEMVARAVTFGDMSRSWKCDSQTALKNGEKTSAGPIWNRIHISRRG